MESMNPYIAHAYYDDRTILLTSLCCSDSWQCAVSTRPDLSWPSVCAGRQMLPGFVQREVEKHA